MHAPLVEPVASRSRAGFCGYHGPGRGFVGPDCGLVAAFGQQLDALAQRRFQIAVEHGGWHLVVAVAAVGDVPDAELRLQRIPGVDLRVAVAALPVAHVFGHEAAVDPVVAGLLAPFAPAQEQDVGLHLGRGNAGEGTCRQTDRAQQLGL